MAYGILTDLTKCIGCESCALACKEVNGLPPGPTGTLTDKTWSSVEHRAGIHVRRQCMHCLDPTCASVCPVAALEKSASGPVIYHEDRCIGCRYCIMACPFEIPKYEWESTAPRVGKCVMCASRIAEGKQPGCTAVCPTGATIFGEREALIGTAQERLRQEPERYVQHIYGLHEAGGTSVLYLSDVPFADLGFHSPRQDGSYPQLTWAILSKLPTVVSVGGVAMLGTWWVIHRRMELERQRAAARAAAGEKKK